MRRALPDGTLEPGQPTADPERVGVRPLTDVRINGAALVTSLPPISRAAIRPA